MERVYIYHKTSMLMPKIVLVDTEMSSQIDLPMYHHVSVSSCILYIAVEEDRPCQSTASGLRAPFGAPPSGPSGLWLKTIDGVGSNAVLMFRPGRDDSHRCFRYLIEVWKVIGMDMSKAVMFRVG